jgi:hypothetical protein
MDYMEFIARVTSHIPNKGHGSGQRGNGESDPVALGRTGLYA